MSTKNLNSLNRASPPRMNGPIERFLKISPTEHAQWLLQQFDHIDTTNATIAPIAIPTPKRSFSHSGSVGSFNSEHSLGSIRSVDSRGFRQGRKSWAEVKTNNHNTGSFIDTSSMGHLQASGPSLVPKPKAEKERPIRRFKFFCTWPSCKAQFRFRCEWMRHEEAKHHCPYHWTCCSTKDEANKLLECCICGAREVPLQHFIDEHFSICRDKLEAQRTFFRRDQFVQHIEGVHLRHLEYNRNIFYVKWALTAAWKTDNPGLEASSLKCGFCGKTFPTWLERSRHVAEHMQEGACKDSWWLDRQPTLSASDNR